MLETHAPPDGGSAERRGRQLAQLLAGSWRTPPPPLSISPELLHSLGKLTTRRGTGGLIWRRLEGSPIAEHPLGRSLRDAFRIQALAVRILEHQLLEVLAFFRAHGLEPVVVKGWSVGRLYPHSAFRPYGDLDLWFLPEHSAQALDLWIDAPHPQAPVEIHDSLPHLPDRDPREVFGRTRLVPLDGVPVRVLAPEDQLRLSALHALGHGLASPLWLVDLAVLIETEGMPAPRLRWDLVLEGDRWLAEGVSLALLLARDLLQAPLTEAGAPAEVVGSERSPVRWAKKAALQAMGTERHYMDPDTPDPESALSSPRTLFTVARRRWANPLEATYRLKAPWNVLPRFPIQTADYLRRSLDLLLRVLRPGAPRFLPPGG